MSQVSLPKVLCVDDEPGLLRSLRWLLRGQYEVAVASSGFDGLALLGAENFDVVISDQRMPGMTGTEFLERAKQVSPRSIRLLLTGYSDFNAVLSSVNDSEVFRFISKPWDNQKLLDTVQGYVGAYGFGELARRYAHNLANGRFLWRNRIGVQAQQQGIRREHGHPVRPLRLQPFCVAAGIQTQQLDRSGHQRGQTGSPG
mgnify:CR=1 FL=1